MRQLSKGLLERVLEAEMTEHLGHESGGTVINPKGNTRNGVSTKTLKGELVFPSRTGNYLQHKNLLRTLRLYSEKANLPKIRMRDLRHTYTSMHIANGADVVRLSRDLGHANASFTLNVHAHLFSRYQEREAPTLNELVGLHENLKKAA